MTHLTLDDLLALREPGAEPGVARGRAHLEQCPACRLEMDRLDQRVARLKALPALRPTRDRWTEVEARLRGERRRQRTLRVGAAGLALAASVTLALFVGDISVPTRVEASNEIVAAMERSRALESAIDDFEPGTRVMDGRTARIASELESLIAGLDQRMAIVELTEETARDEELLRLWRERVGLLDALVDVHVTRASNAGL